MFAKSVRDDQASAPAERPARKTRLFASPAAQALMHFASNEASFGQAELKLHFRQEGSRPAEACRTDNPGCVGAMLNRRLSHSTCSQIRRKNSATFAEELRSAAKPQIRNPNVEIRKKPVIPILKGQSNAARWRCAVSIAVPSQGFQI